MASPETMVKIRFLFICLFVCTSVHKLCPVTHVSWVKHFHDHFVTLTCDLRDPAGGMCFTHTRKHTHTVFC